MNLINRQCLACEGAVSPITDNDMEKYLSGLQGWQLLKGKKEIARDFKFKNFISALKFVNKVAEIAENEGHHPDIEFGWGYCKIRLSTHSIGGLHENDFIIAAKIDMIENV